jgi:murein L,D-transpeptidase YafK
MANDLQAQEVFSFDSLSQYPRVQTAKVETDDKLRELFKTNQLSYPPRDIYWRCFKNEGEVELWARDSSHLGYIKLKTYKVCRQSGTHGPKRKMGDNQVPEGIYHIDLYNPNSSYFLSFRINYPNKSDSILGDRYTPGGDIYIHGSCVTTGCLPMQNNQIKEMFWASIQCQDILGDSLFVPIDVFPLRMDKKNFPILKLEFGYNKTKMNFWNNLKVGYDYFELNKVRPEFFINREGKYVFFKQFIQE